MFFGTASAYGEEGGAGESLTVCVRNDWERESSASAVGTLTATVVKCEQSFAAMLVGIDGSVIT